MFRALLCPKTHEKDSGPFDSGPDVTRSNFEKVHSYLPVINYLSILASFKMARKTCVAHGNIPYLFLWMESLIIYYRIRTFGNFSKERNLNASPVSLDWTE